MKRLILLVFAVHIAMIAQAQREYFIGGHIGGIVPTILNQNSWGAQEYEYRMSPQLEFGVDISLLYEDDKQFYTGFWKTTLGQAYTSIYDGKNWEREIQSDYFIVPLIFRKTIRQGDNLDWAFGVGALWGIRQNATQTWTVDGHQITQKQDNNIWHKPYWVSQPDVDDRYVRNDFMIYLDFGARKYLSSSVYLDILLYGAVGPFDINEEKWKIPNRTKKEYAASRNGFGGIKLCFGFKFAQTGRFALTH